MKNKIWKKILIVSISLLIINLIYILINNKALQYEPSIYESYPIYFWIIFPITIIIPQIYILNNSLSDRTGDKKENNFLIKICFINIFLATTTLVFIPLFRGYLTYGSGDHLTHIGIVNDILSTGHLLLGDTYPNLHTLTGVLTHISSLNVVLIANYTSRIFFLFSPLFLFLFFKTVLKNKIQIMLSILLSSCFLFFGYLTNYLAQCPQSFLLVPLVIFTFFKSLELKNSFYHSIFFVVIGIGFILYHPLNALLIIIVISVPYFIIKFNPNQYKKYFGYVERVKTKIIHKITLSASIFIAWYFSFSSILQNFRKVFVSIFADRGSGSLLEKQVQSLNTFTPRIFDLLRLALFNYGIYAIIFFISLIGIIYIHRKQNNTKSKYQFIFSYSLSLFFIFFFLSGIAFLFDIIASWERYIRWLVLFFFLLFSVIFTIYFSNNYNKKKKYIFPPISFIKKQTFKKGFIIFLFTIFLVISIFSFFPDPLNGNKNEQVTKMDYLGSEWSLSNIKDGKKFIHSYNLNIYRFSDLIFGYSDDRLDYQIKLSLKNENPEIKEHFNYKNNDSLGYNYDYNSYLIITRSGKLFYPSLYPNYRHFWKFNENDFLRLKNDDTVNRLYTNSDFELNIIISKNK